MCKQLPDGSYVPITKVRLLIDTGNTVETLIPSSLLPYMFELKKCHEEIFSFNTQEGSAVARLRGSLICMTQMNDGSWDFVKISGLVMDECPEDEIILARNALSSTIELRAGNHGHLQCQIAGSLTPICLNEDCSTTVYPIMVPGRELTAHDKQLLKQDQNNRILRVTHLKDGTLQEQNGVRAITSLMEDMGVSSKGISPSHADAIDRLLIRIHRFTGHAHYTIIQK